MRAVPDDRRQMHRARWKNTIPFSLSVCPPTKEEEQKARLQETHAASSTRRC